MLQLLQNLKNFLDFLPKEGPNPPEIDFEKEKLTDEEKKEIIEFGKQAFPYVYAYSRVFDDCCRVKEEAGIHNYIKDELVKERFDKYIKDGGDVEMIRQGKVEEDYLTEEDIEAFMKAEREVHKEVHREVEQRIAGQDKEDFEQYVKEGKEKVSQVQKKINSLRLLAGELPDYTAEINQKIKELEKRWVNYKNEPTNQDLEEVLEYYSSILET